MIDQNRFALNRSAYPKLGIPEFFELASGLGIHKVELRNDLPTGIIDKLSPEEVKGLAEKYGIRIVTINRLPEFNHGNQSPELLGELKDMLKLAVSINCEAIILVPSRSQSDTRGREEVFQDTVKALKMLHPYFEDSGVLGYVEILGFMDCSVRSVLDGMNAIRQSGSNSYKVVYDTFHHFLGPDSAEDLEKSLDVSYIGLVHISGVTTAAAPEKITDADRVMVGPEDRLGNTRQLAMLERLGYRGNISFEPFSKAVQELDLQQFKESARKSIKFVQDATH